MRDNDFRSTPPTSTPTAAELRDSPYSRQASVAELIATDAVAQVTTDAVQVFGPGLHPGLPSRHWAKVTQIFEDIDQIQRLVIARQLAG